MQTSNLLRCRIAIVLWIVAHCNGSVVDVDSCSLHSIEATARDRVEWTKFVSNYGKLYTSPTERQRRFEIFQQNLCLARKRNRAEEGTAVFGVTVFSDHEESEFQKTRLNAKTSVPLTSRTLQPKEQLDDHLPSSFDWRDHNAVTAVKDQASDTSWITAAVENIESLWAIKTRTLHDLSTQYVMDCGSFDYKGSPDEAIRFIMRSGGIFYAKDYNSTCGCSESEADNVAELVTVDGVVHLQQQSISKYLVRQGPVASVVCASDLQHYQRGIIKTKKRCHILDQQSVLIVGFGKEGNTEFWIVKNSWGVSWGEAGYFRIIRGFNAMEIEENAVTAMLFDSNL